MMRRDVNVLCREIVLSKFDPQVIVGISRGGLVPGVMMSHWFKKPFKPIKASIRDFSDEDDAWEDYYPRKNDERVLIVDDVLSTGGTLDAIIQGVESLKANISSVVVVVEKGPGLKILQEKYPHIQISSIVRLEMDGDSVVLLDELI